MANAAKKHTDADEHHSMIPKFERIPERGLIFAIAVKSRVISPKLISNIMLTIAIPIRIDIEGMPVINNCCIDIFFILIPFEKLNAVQSFVSFAATCESPT